MVWEKELEEVVNHEIINKREKRDIDKQSIISILKKNLEINSFEGMFINCGYGQVRFSIPSLCDYLIEKSEKIGTNKAINNLMRFIDLDYSPIEEVLIISGVEVKKPIEIYEGVSLCPFEIIKRGHENSSYGFFNPNKSLARIPYTEYFLTPPHAALVLRRKARPKLSNDHMEIVKGNVIRKNLLFEICLSIRLISELSAIPLAYLFQLEEWVPLSSLTPGWIEVITMFWKNIQNSLNIEKRKIPTITKFINLRSEDKSKIIIVLEKIRENERSQLNITERAINTRIMLEALLLSDNEDNSLFRYKVGMRGAKFLGGNISKRKENLKTFKDAYDYGSVAIHKGGFKSTNTENVYENIGQINNMVIDLIKKIIIKGGLPNWDDFLLG